MTGSFTRWSGLAFCIAAVTTLALNILVSPHLPQGAFAVVAASQIYVTLFSVEYGQAFTVHDYALYAPDMLNTAMTDLHRPLAIGALTAIAGFFFGWLLLAISLLVSRDYSRVAAVLIIIGLPLAFLTKGLGVYGGIVTSLVTGGLFPARAPDDAAARRALTP